MLEFRLLSGGWGRGEGEKSTVPADESTTLFPYLEINRRSVDKEFRATAELSWLRVSRRITLHSKRGKAKDDDTRRRKER